MIWVEAYDDDAKKELKDTQITVNSKSDKLSSQFSIIESKYESAMNEVSGIAKTFSDISQELNKGEDPTNTTKTNDLIKGISDKVSGYVDNMEKLKNTLITHQRNLMRQKLLLKAENCITLKMRGKVQLTIMNLKTHLWLGRIKQKFRSWELI